ncbi:MAG: hypothetical protein EHM20_17405 [Alphaproteobacteria bacterium]|nr:MAG: hypothetical protein EHM20_17405 [Alphaproteobacteria bacterium]
MKKRILSAVAALSLTASASFACDIHGKGGFAPENNLKISQWDKASNSMTKERFLAIVKSVSDIYEPIVKAKGGTLSMNNRWDDDTVNASAQQIGKKWVVNMYGGLARHQLTFDDGFALVVCHELGHHIGGAPRKGMSWAANEGQADYFGSMKCLRRVLEKQDNITAVSKMTIDAEATKQCEMIYKNADEVALCQRVSMAGKSLGQLLGSLGGSSKINFDTPDKTTVTKTNDNHPAAQCRLDTYFSGILCDKSYDQDTDKNDPKIGTCIARDGYKSGVRPLCWYKPATDEI